MNPVTRNTAAPTLADLGLDDAAHVSWNAPTPLLVQQAIVGGEGRVAEGGALVVATGAHTGRSAKDKYVVREADSGGEIWWGSVNHEMSEAQFLHLKEGVAAHLAARPIWVTDASVGADPACRVAVRLVSERAWQSLFARIMFLPAVAEGGEHGLGSFTILHAPGFHPDPAEDGTRSDVVIALNLRERIALIAGTEYAGEIKKTMFTVANFLLPRAGVLPMHCSANAGEGGDVAIFFGLSGTGKTTLSTEPTRRLIGDDEHGWSDTGVFNIEGGCYAKVINLSATDEPDIFAATRRFGTVVENVPLDAATGRLALDDATITENTRAAYPIAAIPNALDTGIGGHPANIVMLTADAFGVLPPVARLTSEQAMYHFLSGYTAKVAGTERGVTEPTATFSACFGAPFLPLPPIKYAHLLGERIGRHRTQVWLVNTGWTGGPYGVGRRMPIAATRAIVHAILDGSLSDSTFVRHPFFGIEQPTSCPGVAAELLDQRTGWADGDAYDAQARRLAGMFVANFAQFAPLVDPAVLAAAPTQDGRR
ncbi:MAG: phosphoenolpyruvate carboxykinase (ATP) [Thermomicrobiales bacterium]